MEAAEAAASKKLEEELSALRVALGKEHAAALREAELGQAAALREAHMVATEDILVNVDGDNLIGCDFPVDIVERFD